MDLPVIIPDQSQPSSALEGQTITTSKGSMRRWSVEEKARLVEEVDQKMKVAEIAAKHDRSEVAIECQLYKLAQAAITGGMSAEDARAKYEYSDKTVKMMEAMREKGKTKKAAKNSKVDPSPTPQLPFAATPQDRVLAFNQFVQRLKEQVETFKLMGVTQPELEEQIARGLAHVCRLIESYQALSA